MTKKNSVKKSEKLDKKEQTKTQSANTVKQKKPKKVRLHSKLKVNVPLTQSLMLILPSLAKHASAETVSPTDNSTLAHQDSTNNQESAVHQSADISKDENKKTITRNIHDSDAIVGQESSSTGGETTLRPSHHLSSSSHPQAHYIPASSIPSIESGGITAPTNNVPTTPSLPVTFTPEVIKGIYGELHVDSGGKYTFVLNPLSPQYVLLHQNQPGTDKFVLHLSNGSSVVVQIPVTGKQDVPTISGDLHGIVTEDSNVDSHGLLNAAGKIDVVDPDHDQSSVLAETITGKYGTLTIDSNGAWHYQVDNSLPNIQALTSLTSLHESFTIHTKDGTPQALEMTIGGIDDNAVVTGLDTGTLIEDSTLHAHGQLTVSDLDLNQDHFQSEQLQGHWGSLSIQPDGSWTYDLDNTNPKVQSLSKGSTVTDIITVHSADGTPHQITLTINGTNDKAVITTGSGGSPHSYLMGRVKTIDGQVTEETNLTASGVLNVTDVDANQAHFSNTDIKGALGTLHLTDNGIWTYTLDNKNPTVQALGKRHSATDTITIHSADGTSHHINIFVNGTNDGALISGTDTGKVTEETMLTTSGQLKITDVDTGEAHFSNTDIAGALGTLHLTDTGGWTYDLDNTNPTVQALGKGSTATDTITVHSADGTPHQVTITVNGTNDKATVSSATVAINETDKAVTTSGTLTSTDVDNPDNTFTPDSIVGSNGDLTIDANGQWTFTANSAFNQLNVGDKVEETFTVSSVDGTPSTIKVMINGTNDKATVSSATVAIDETDKAVTTSGTLTSTDVDNPDNAFTPDSITGTNGDLTIDANGHWFFTANSAFNQLNIGDKVEETFTVSSVDGTPSTIKVTINGTNDAATVSSATVAIDETDKAVTTSGTLTSTDVDNPDNAFTPDSISGTNGDLTIDTNGHWVFTANSAFNQLNVSDKVEETFTVSSVDGTPSTIKVTINGTNDAATVSSATVAIDETDKAVTTSGTLTSTDVDNPDNAFTPDSIAGTNGDLNIDANGHWVFTANSAFNQLNVGDKIEETFTVSSIDGTASTIKVTINGTNDKATVSTATVSVDETDKAVTTSGTLTSTDVDNPDNAFTPDFISGTNGDLTIDANGHWVFTANSAFNQLNVGDKVEETFTVSSVDGTASTIKVAINGTNDAATVSSATVAIDETDRAVTTSGTLTSIDVDNPDNAFTPDSISGTNGDLTIDANGHWVFTANSAFNQLNVGDKVEETFTVSSIDGTASTIKVTINGTNDAATVSTATVSVDETDKAVTTSGTLTSTDVDNPDNAFTPDSITGTNGDLTIDANGHWSFTANSAFNQLNVGDKVEETFTVSSVDGTTSTIKVTINGTNDAATVSSATVAIDETDKAVTTSGTLTSTDVDNPDNTFTPDSIVGSNGDLTIDANGHWVFTANSAFNQLNVGDKVEETFTVSSVDGTPSTIKITINGTNDTPVIKAQSHSVIEGGSLLNGQMVGHDIDAGGTLTYSAPQVDGLVINPDGSYSFNPSHSTYLSLASGITKTLTIPVTVTDEHNASSTQNLSIIITGVNNSATVSGVDSGDVTEGNAGQDMSPDYAQPGMAFLGRSTIHTTGKLNITDVDTGEAEFDTHGIGFTYSGQYGDLLLNKDGSWSYHADTGQIRSTGGLTSTRGTTIDQLGENQTLTDTVTVFTKDGTSHDIVITIHGSNDRPYCASEVQLNSGKEDLAQTITSTELLANTVDVDANDAGQLSITNLHADHGSIRDNNDGTFTFTPNSDYNGKIQFSYDVKDAHGGVTSTSASLDLAPVDDAAVITGQHAGDITEDNLQSYQSALTVKGHLHVVDPDGGEAQFTSVTKIDDPYNTTQNGLSISPNGAWSYDVNNNLSSVQNMAEGETKDIVYEVQTVDGTKQRITITLHGTNDSPILQFTSYGNASAGSNPISTDEDKAITISIDRFVGAGKDIDHGDTLHIEQLQVDHGKAVLSADGQSVIYTPEKDFNGHATFTYQIADSHGALAINPATGHPGLSGMMIDVNAMPDNAVIGGDITGGVTEDKMMGMALLQAHGTLTITDPDAGEAQFLPNDGVHNNGYETAMGGLVTINPKTGDWSYVVDNFKTEVQSLGATETAVDTVTIHSKDGTAQQIQITIHGVNDNPTVSSVVTLASGTEDTDQTIQASDLLALATDVDKNDAGQLTLGAISVDHGSITDNHDGTYTLHQEANYNGQVSLSYDIKDIHGGSVATSASLQLAAVNDNPDVQPLTDRVIEGATSPHHLDLLAGATDKEGDALNIEQLSFSVDGGKSSQLLPSGLSIAKDGHTLLVDATDPAFNYLNAGQPLNIVASYLVSDGHGGQTQQTAVLTIEGTDDKAVLVSNVIQMSETDALQSEFTRYQGKLQIIDPDTGDNTQFQFGGVYIGQGFPPGELDIWPDGSYSFHLETALNRHADDLVSSLHQGESMEFPYTVKTTDGQTVTIMVKVIGEDSQARIEVGRYSSVDNHVTEDHFTPGSTHNLISSSGHLHVIDPDHDQAGFIAQNINTPEGGHFHINARGSWAYNIDNSKLQHLGAGESYQKTFTVESIDGSAHRDITVTVHGTNDNPVISSAISLPAGVEDTKIILTSPQLLANTTDIDDNDAGQLSIANLQTDHGSILANTNGTFTFTPEANYHGQVKFTYDVKDAHGGITHTSASTTLAAVNDAGVITGDKSGTITEDSHVQGDAQHTIYTVGVLDVTDPDAGENHFHESHNVHALHDPFGGSFTIGKAGDWSYSVPNANVQHLAKDQVETVQYEVITQGGDKQIVTVSIHGTNDDPILSITQTTPVTGTLTETDVDVKDTHSFSVVSPTGQFGDLSVDPTSGAYVYTPNSSVSGMSYNSATHTYHGADVFEVKVADNHGGESSRFLTFDTNGQVNLITGQQPTITTTVPQNPIVTTAQPSLPTSSNTPPSNTVTVDLVASSDSGKSDTDNLTNNNTPTITGHTDVPYSQVTIYDGLTPIGHAVSDGSGQYSAVVTNLTDGDHNLSAKALAPSSSLPATSPLLSVHVDTTIAPLTIELTHDTGSNASDSITSGGALTITGQEAGATVEYSTDNGQTWTSSFTPQQGSNTVSVRQTDTAGNVSTNTSLSFTLDNSIAAPTVSLVQDTGRHLINTPDLITQDSQLSIQTEAGAKIEYSNDGGHSWTAVFNPAEGVNNLQVRQTDIAGNVSPATHFSFTLDTTPGTVTVNPISQDNALNAAENNQPLVITGTTSNVDPGDVVYVIVGNNHFYDATVKSDGSWSLTLSASAHQSILAADHDYPIQVGSVDAAGNSTPRISTHLLVDTQNPIPHIAVDSVTQDNVLNALESGQSIPITGTVTGDYHTGDTVSLKINGANIPSLTGTVDAAGHFSIPVAGNVLERANIHTSYASGQAAPIHSIEATIQTTDAVGNTGSATTGSQVFTVDTQIHIGIHTDPVTVDNVINDQESYSSVDITGSVSGDFNTGDVVTLNVNGIKHTGAVDSHGHYSIAVPGSELIADADQKIEASIAVTDSAGNSAHATTDVVYQVDTQVSLPTITFESAGADNLYSKAEIARGDANTITATITPPGDAKIGEHININGVDHVLDAHSLQNGLQIEVAPGSHVQVTMTDEHGNTAGSQGFAASAIPDPIIVKAPPGSHQVSGSLGTPPLLPSLTPVPTAQHGWRIHLPDGSYVTSHHGQYGTLTIDPQTGDLHYQEQANVHTGPHGSASGIGQHEDKFEVALQGTNQDEVVAHVNVQILSHGPGNSGKLNIGTEVVDMTITPITHTSHPAPPPPPPVLHDEPDMSSQADFTVTQSDDSYLDLTQHAHQVPDQKTSHHGAAAYLDALGIKPDATSTTVDDQPADMDIVLAQVDQQDAATHDQAHLDMSDALEHHDANINHNQDDEHHHHNDVDGLPDIDPNP
ncbi:VCBS domain-containing protein [Vibrio crassostreae]|uniref:VCBS domain-containing protein n=1 Tax=Vibrio crassostreae TaxID=246167 RepID=UPI000635F5C4|nr:VCBS domain-containing protein [Vibrio crassostreae]TCO06277.1 VCBS repeat-containing protein [Vibrio crassostreae]CAK1854616.1 Tandem-95 repeat protein [Vibrio crassostreae]CAK1856385.1 Tandem-95 repeat protein [Vibrio crassostreae]CAK1896717.1 Tandem-95 repeat protein [Vibrio crassostreae]CAK2156371.1 Tandem-95 repeat protein [Vibrio crassostreae]